MCCFIQPHRHIDTSSNENNLKHHIKLMHAHVNHSCFHFTLVWWCQRGCKPNGLSQYSAKGDASPVVFHNTVPKGTQAQWSFTTQCQMGCKPSGPSQHSAKGMQAQWSFTYSCYHAPITLHTSFINHKHFIMSLSQYKSPKLHFMLIIL